VDKIVALLAHDAWFDLEVTMHTWFAFDAGRSLRRDERFARRRWFPTPSVPVKADDYHKAAIVGTEGAEESAVLRAEV
jgi:hypothetical protein